jgi:tRNA A-37 threonylcarbamoyl transferase component Bud32
MTSEETITTSPQSVKLTGQKLAVARGLWFLMAAFTVYLFIAGLPRSFDIGLHLLPETHQALERTGIPLTLPAYILVGTDTVTFLFFAFVALLLVWRRGDEIATLVTASMLLFTGGLYTGPTANGDLPNLVLAILPGLAETMQAWFVFLFPDGRALPRWIWWLLIPLPLWRIGIWFVDYVPNYKAAFRTVENYSHTAQQAWDIGLFMLLLVGGVIAQVIRYRKLSTPIQRQQTKWVLFGMAATIAFVGSYVIVFNVLGYGESSSLLTSLAARILRQVALMIVPVTMAIAILRYRLWDIDFAINRSLVYAGLTAILLGLFALSLWAVSRVAANFEAAPLAALPITAVVFALVFVPLRRALQRFIDRQFYHIHIDYQKPARVSLPPIDQIPFPRAHFDEYTGLELAGRGGMAEVYKAVHPTLHRSVAIKIMRETIRDDPTMHVYFERESRALTKLDHPNIIKVLDVGRVDDRPYIVMEFIDGPALNLILKNSRLDRQTALNILRPVCAALDYLHSHQIIHRDVKPGNILLAKSEDAMRPTLTDFGLAKVIGDPALVSQSVVAGTFAYIAPEQIEAKPDIDGRADLYALGVMTFELLTGDLPFKHEQQGALLIAHMLHPAPDPRDKMPDLPVGVARAIQTAMAKDPAQRFASAKEFLAALAAP